MDILVLDMLRAITTTWVIPSLLSYPFWFHIYLFCVFISPLFLCLVYTCYHNQETPLSRYHHTD